jgi:hypothetical protein
MKTIILGMNYPKEGGGEPLEIDVIGSSGWRLFCVSGMTAKVYSICFERRNLVAEHQWDDAKAKIAAEAFFKEMIGTRRKIICLGRPVWDAFGWMTIDWCESLSIAGCEWFLLPHPSGRNRWYNEQHNVARARKVLRRAAMVPA